MFSTTIRKTVLTTVTVAALAAVGATTANAGKGGGGGHGSHLTGNGMGLYFANQAVDKHTRKKQCYYRNKWVLNQHNQLVYAKVQTCY